MANWLSRKAKVLRQTHDCIRKSDTHATASLHSPHISSHAHCCISNHLYERTYATCSKAFNSVAWQANICLQYPKMLHV